MSSFNSHTITIIVVRVYLNQRDSLLVCHALTLNEPDDGTWLSCTD